MKPIRLFALLAMLLVPAIASAQWSNEPAGSTLLLDCRFDHPTCNGLMQDPYNSSGTLPSPPSAGTLSVTSDSSAPLSPASVLRSTMNKDVRVGGTELHYAFPPGLKEVYVGFLWRTNPDFSGNGVGANKTMFIKGPVHQNGVFLFQHPQSIPSVSRFYWTTQNPNNLDQCGGSDIDQCFPNVRTTFIVPGTWYKFETYFKASTCATCKNGIVRWWINGQLEGNFTNFAYGPDLAEWVWSETWDGASNGAGFLTNPSHYLDHIHISAPNCPSGGCGTTGGGSDTTPPGQVTSVTVTQLN